MKPRRLPLKDMPLDKPVVFQISLDRAKHRKLKAIAALGGLSIADIVREFIEKFLAQEEGKNE
jgi:hypothetical protein